MIIRFFLLSVIFTSWVILECIFFFENNKIISTKIQTWVDMAVTPHQCGEWESKPQWLEAIVYCQVSVHPRAVGTSTHTATYSWTWPGPSSTLEKASCSRILRQAVLLQGLMAPPLRRACHIITVISRKASPTMYLTPHPSQVTLGKSPALPLPQFSTSWEQE